MLARIVLVLLCLCSSALARGGGHVTTFDSNLFPGAVIKNLKTDYGAVCNGVTDDSAAYQTFLTFAVAQTSPVVLVMPPPGCKIVFSGFNLNVNSINVSEASIKNFTLWAYGATSDAYIGHGPFPTSNTTVGLLQSAATNDTSVTLITAGDSSNYSVGQWICVCGLELQNGGYPPNFQFYDLRLITAINAGTGVISLNAPLSHVCLSTWPSNNVKDGPCAVWPLLASWNSIATVYGLTVLDNGQQMPITGRTTAFYDMVIPVSRNVAVTQTQSHFAAFTYLGSPEIDKIISNATLYRCGAKQIAIQSPTPDNLVIDSCTIDFTLGGSTDGLIRNTTIGLSILGPANFGVASALVLDGTRIAVNQQNTTRQNLLSDLTLTSGTLSIAKTNPNRFTFLATFVPGFNYYYAASDCSNNSVPATSFTVSAVREDAANFYADTNIVGTPSPLCGAVACSKICPWPYQSITQLNTPAGGVCVKSFGVTGKGC
jgi:hypothetical protein